MSEDCCAIGCDVREGSCFQSSEKRHQNRPTFVKLTCSARSSRESPFSDVRADIFPSAFRTFPKIVFVIFIHFCAFFFVLKNGFQTAEVPL